MDRHNDAVASIATTVHQFYLHKQAFRIYHGSTNSTRSLSLKRINIIDTSNLSHVLEINAETKTMLVEPNVPMDQLVAAAYRHGLIPPVVMEFPGITVGGGFAGTSGESSSFKHGFFDETVVRIEMVLANGEVVHASETERPDLFHGAAGSFGTFGVLTLLEIRLIEAKTYVELTYIPITSVPEAIRKMEEATRDISIDYVDGILFALEKGVIMTGRLTDVHPPGVSIQRFSRARDQWFYLHCQNRITASSAPITDLIPIVDYLFRYDRGGFWAGSYTFPYFLTPFNRITRWALDYFLHTRVMYHAMHESGLANQNIIQDLAIPQSSAQQFIEYLHSSLGLYPLWLCPLRRSQEIALHPHHSLPSSREMLLNIGVWGPGPTNHTEFVALNRQLEQKARQLSGMKWMYAHVFYTEVEFWDIYDRKWYDALRLKYDATSLPSVYEKVRTELDLPKGMIAAFWRLWPFAGLYGVFKAIMGSSYLLEEKRRSLRGIFAVLVGVLVVLVWR